jgi:hypothetical protein
VSVRIKFATVVHCKALDQPEKVLDFGAKNILNTSLMHSRTKPELIFRPLASIFQVTDFKEKKF